MRIFEKKIASEYNSRFLKYGAQPKSSLWFSKERQILRFDLIISLMKDDGANQYFSVNDIGCGYGGFLERLMIKFRNKEFSYFGFDVAENPIEFCKHNFDQQNVRFYCRSTPVQMADYSVMSGTFNYAPGLSVSEWTAYLFGNLNSIWSLTRRSMIFNLMISDEAVITSQDISYIKKETVVNFCQKNFGDIQQFYSSKLPKELTFCVSR